MSGQPEPADDDLATDLAHGGDRVIVEPPGELDPVVGRREPVDRVGPVHMLRADHGDDLVGQGEPCLLYTSPSPRD